MKQKLASFFGGILLIAAGGIALAQTQGLLTKDVNPIIWTAIFAAISVVSLVFYFISGVQNWVMLFPAGIFGALALLVTMAANNVNNQVMAAPLFVGVGVPFAVAFFIDRTKNWWAVIPVGVMVALAAAFTTNPFLLILVLPLAGMLGGWLFKNLWVTPLVVATVTLIVVASQGSDGLLAGRLMGGAIYAAVGAGLTLTGGVTGWLFKFAMHKESSS